MRAARTTDAALRSFAAKKKEKEKIAKKNQLVSRICDALDNLKDLDEKNKERLKRIQQEILDITSEDEQDEEGEQGGAKRQEDRLIKSEIVGLDCGEKSD